MLSPTEIVYSKQYFLTNINLFKYTHTKKLKDQPSLICFTFICFKLSIFSIRPCTFVQLTWYTLIKKWFSSSNEKNKSVIQAPNESHIMMSFLLYQHRSECGSPVISLLEIKLRINQVMTQEQAHESFQTF